MSAAHRGAYPTSLDLYAELRAVTPDSLRPMLSDWFETITLWDVKTERAVAEPSGTGEYVVTLGRPSASPSRGSPRAPASTPYRKLIDRQRDDNVVRVEAAGDVNAPELTPRSGR